MIKPSRLIPLVGLCLASPSHASETEISFASGAIMLAGTLMLPGGSAPRAAIVFLHGSGPEKREWLRPLAEHATEAGYAALIFDKRGTGNSQGSWTRSSLDDLAGDAVAAVDFLCGHAALRGVKVGLWATSQSGWYAPLAANRSADVSFVIISSGGALSPREVEWFGYERALSRSDVRGADLASARRLVTEYLDYLASGEGFESLSARIEEAKLKPWHVLPLERVLPSPEDRSAWAWVATFDPASSIEKLRAPLLVFVAGNDEFAPGLAALSRWSDLLQRSAAPATLRWFAEAGHGMTMGGHGHEPQQRQWAIGFFETAFSWLASIVAGAGP